MRREGRGVSFMEGMVGRWKGRRWRGGFRRALEK
jgi:hypothetical protein